MAQTLPRTPGVPLDLWRRDDNRAPRAGLGQQCWHGAREPLDGGSLQPPRLRTPDRIQRLRSLRRWLHDGGHRLRSCLTRRALEALQPLMDLRKQPRHDRGEHRARVQQGRRHPFPRLRLECHRGRQRPAPGDSLNCQRIGRTVRLPEHVLMVRRLDAASCYRLEPASPNRSNVILPRPVLPS